VKKTRHLLLRCQGKETPKVLGKSLPHQNLNYKAGEPSLGVSIAPAYMSASSALPSSLPKTPTEADLAPTIDTSQTTAIKDLANKLGKDPIKIYEFVRNTIIYTPYYGSRKGAKETLWEKQGNDIDQANLLISLYRYLILNRYYISR
jgi:transglutaminase-like putative cysteine protease